jgi:hypothetical protein
MSFVLLNDQSIPFCLLEDIQKNIHKEIMYLSIECMLKAVDLASLGKWLSKCCVMTPGGSRADALQGKNYVPNNTNFSGCLAQLYLLSNVLWRFPEAT